jgi:hypothetical protein
MMEKLLLILPLLACPLAMAAMAGAAWVWAKARAVPTGLRDRLPESESRALRGGGA